MTNLVSATSLMRDYVGLKREGLEQKIIKHIFNALLI